MKKLSSIRYLCALGLLGVVTLMSGCTTLTYTTASIIGNKLTLGMQIEDEAIEHHAQDKVSQLKLNKDNNNITLKSYNAHLLVVGQVQSLKVKKEIVHEVAHVRHVEKVYDYLNVAPVRTQAEWLSDSYISTKVKSSIFFSDASHFHFDVITERGVVYLMGKASPAEALYVEEKVKKLDGVKKVITLFFDAAKRSAPVHSGFSGNR